MKRGLVVLAVLLACAPFLVAQRPAPAADLPIPFRTPGGRWAVVRASRPSQGRHAGLRGPARSGRSRHARRPPREGGAFRKHRLPRCRGEGADDARHDLPAGLDDQADRRGRHADALRGRPPSALGPDLEVAPRVQGHEGVAAGAGRRLHHRARADADHRPAPADAHERCAERRRRAAAGLREDRAPDGSQGHAGRLCHAAGRDAAQLRARHGVALRCRGQRTRRRRPPGRGHLGTVAGSVPDGADLPSAEDERHVFLSAGRKAGPLRRHLPAGREQEDRARRGADHQQRLLPRADVFLRFGGTGLHRVRTTCAFSS